MQAEFFEDTAFIRKLLAKIETREATSIECFTKPEDSISCMIVLRI